MEQLALLWKAEALTETEISALIATESKAAILCGLVVFVAFMRVKFQRNESFDLNVLGPALAVTTSIVGTIKAAFLFANVFRPEMLHRLADLPLAVGFALAVAVVLTIITIRNNFANPEVGHKEKTPTA